jgi:hypothetical protein
MTDGFASPSLVPGLLHTSEPTLNARSGHSHRFSTPFHKPLYSPLSKATVFGNAIPHAIQSIQTTLIKDSLPADVVYAAWICDPLIPLN